MSRQLSIGVAVVTALGLMAIAFWLWHTSVDREPLAVGESTPPVFPADAEQVAAGRDSSGQVPATTVTRENAAEQVPSAQSAAATVVLSELDAQVQSLGTEPREAAAAVGMSGWSDADFATSLARLRTDPDFLLAVQDEFRLETDARRLRRISQLLGELGSPALTELAEALLYSGSEEARFGAMDLLRRQQAIDPRAREIALDLLSTSSEEAQLVAAMNILSAPAVALPQQQQAIVAQMTALSDNPSPTVRRQSLGILGRWVEDDASSEVFLRGLRDSDSRVRQSAAYALVDYPFDNAALKAALWSIVEDVNATSAEVSSALLAYQSMPLSAAERQQLQAVAADRRQ